MRFWILCLPQPRARDTVSVELSLGALEDVVCELEVDRLVQHRELEVGDGGDAPGVDSRGCGPVAGLQPLEDGEEHRGLGQEVLQPGLDTGQYLEDLSSF